MKEITNFLYRGYLKLVVKIAESLDLKVLKVYEISLFKIKIVVSGVKEQVIKLKELVTEIQTNHANRQEFTIEHKEEN